MSTIVVLVMFIASKFAPFNMYMPVGVPVDSVSVWASKHARRLKTNQGSISLKLLQD